MSDVVPVENHEDAVMQASPGHGSVSRHDRSGLERREAAKNVLPRHLGGGQAC